jgi:hypothetical protein
MEKTRLTYQYLQYSFELYRGARRNLKRHFNGLEAQGVRRVVFYGVSEIAEIAYISLQETSIKMVAIVDEKSVGKIFLRNEVKDPRILNSLSFDRILITSIKKDDSQMERLLQKGISNSKIVMLV